MSCATATMPGVENAPATRATSRGRPTGGTPVDKPEFTRGKGCNNRKLSDADRAEIVRLYTTRLPDGTWMGVTAIARRFGVAHNCIQDRLKRAGVQMRSAKEAHAHGKACKPVKNLPTTLPLPCKCGCGEFPEWNRRKNRWNAYVKGHYTRAGEQSPMYIDGRSHLPYTEDWPEISLAMRKRDGWECQRCHGDSRNLHVHHIDQDKQNNDPENLVTLCAPCHGQVHAELRRGVVPSCQS